MMSLAFLHERAPASPSGKTRDNRHRETPILWHTFSRFGRCPHHCQYARPDRGRQLRPCVHYLGQLAIRCVILHAYWWGYCRGYFRKPYVFRGFWGVFTGFENQCAGNRTAGSNPALSVPKSLSGKGTCLASGVLVEGEARADPLDEVLFSLAACNKPRSWTRYSEGSSS